VVGVDGAAGGWSALAWARDEVAATGGRLTICRAGPPPSGGSTMDAVELADPVLARFVHDTRNRIGGERVALWLAPGASHDVLQAAARDADLLVVGAPEASSRRGSTALRVAAEAAVPVVVVRPLADSARRVFAGHVVAAVAGAGVDPLVLDFGMRYAAVHRLPLVAVHVTPHADEDYWFDERTLETHFVDEPAALGVLAAVVEPFLPRYPGVAVKLGVLTGDPVPRLIDTSRGARLTVLGRRHRRLAARVLGSVSRGVAAAAEGPLAVVPTGWASR
jgi:nucleotide-binding universal stress UspA family protein